MNQLIDTLAAMELIASGISLCIAGPESELDKLPPGNWIGGTIPYFMVPSGGVVVSEGQVFVTDISAVGKVSFATYGPHELEKISGHCPENGIAITIIPAGSSSHQIFAAEAANYEKAFLQPTVGWISGVHLSQIGSVTPKVYAGSGSAKYDDCAVVAYVEMPPDKLAAIEIVNLFEPDQGDLLNFTSTGFEVTDCLVNGMATNFADYIRSKNLQHGQLPMVGDYVGAYINVSLQNVGEAGGKVALYAPVFPNVDYHFARPVDNYERAFRARLATQQEAGLFMSCNCILNFLFGELEGKSIGGVAGPVTFGEIAYQLLNQTMVAVRVY
jgi:hypothetical protein